MKYTPENTKDMKIVVRDSFGKVIPNVISYDTETKEIEVYMTFDYECDDCDENDIFSSKKVKNRMAITSGEEIAIFKTVLKNSSIEIDGARADANAH